MMRNGTHEGLDMEEEHAENAMAWFVKHEEVDEGILLASTCQDKQISWIY